MRPIGTVVIALVVFAAAACSPAASAVSTPTGVLGPAATSLATGANPSPSPSEAASLEPTPADSSKPADPGNAADLAIDGYAQVVTNDLRVRSEPGVSDDSTRLTPLLQDGLAVLVLDGPVPASGYDWYFVQPVVDYDSPSYPFGWVAAGKDGEVWLEPATVDCPPLPTSVGDLIPSEDGTAYSEIACWGGKQITFRARLQGGDIACGAESPWGVDPEWLGGCSEIVPYLLPADETASGVPFWPSYHPEVDLDIAPEASTPVERTPIVEVVGLYDHPAARTCRHRVNYVVPDTREPDPALAVFYCRLQFVVTSMREVD